MTGEPETAPRTLSRKERREREAAAEREKNSRAAKRAKREAEYAAPPADLPPLPVRARRAEREDPEEKAPKKRSRRASEAPITPDAPAPRGGWKLPVIIVCVVLLLLLALVVTGALLVHKVDTIYPGVTIADTDLSGMTRNEARDKLLVLGHERYDGYSVTANLPLGNTLAMSSADAGMRFSADTAADAAWNYGRGDGLFGALVKYVQCRYLVKCSIVVGEDSITLLKGASSMTLDTDSVFNSFRDAFLSGGSTSFTYESAPNTDESFDFQSLYNDIYSEVAEAEIVYNPDIETTDPGKDDGKGEKPAATPEPTATPAPSDTP